MKDKMYSNLTEGEKAEIISNHHVIGFKDAENDMQCGNYNENLEPNNFCRINIKKGNIIYISDFMSIDCCSIDCCDDVFRSSMD
tara:strand:- start:2461 stop:2712 length:252 start_codon:yes stop_codon:yes gene_type:complete